jgi:hypothetical protein
VPHDLLTIASELHQYLQSLQDPASAPAGLRSALSAVRTFRVRAGGSGPPAPNLELLGPSDSVPRPAAIGESGPGAPVAPSDLMVVAPLPIAGPAGAPGDIGPAGPVGPIGPGVDLERLERLEAAVLDLQVQSLLPSAIG